VARPAFPNAVAVQVVPLVALDPAEPCGHSGRIAAVSLAVFTSPPPETVAVLVTLAGELADTLTTNATPDSLAPAANTSLRVAVSGDRLVSSPGR